VRVSGPSLVPRRQSAEVTEVAEHLRLHGDGLMRTAFLLPGDEDAARALVVETLVTALGSWADMPREDLARADTSTEDLTTPMPSVTRPGQVGAPPG
jgi:hypothetical protein